MSEGLSVSEIGKRLIQGSHWLTIYVTSRLLKLGVERQSILWNVEHSGEEVDILAEFMGRLWIFELKDRDFGSGDAHPFNYRKVRYNANEAVVVTSGKVLADARKVFQDLSDGARRMSAANRSPLYVEGLEAVLPNLKMAFERAADAQAKGLLYVPSIATGFDLRAAIGPGVGSAN